MRFEDDPRRVLSLGSGFRELEPIDIRNHLAACCQRTTQKRVAIALGVSPQYLCDIIKGRREISEQVAEKLGFERVVTFVRWGSPEAPLKEPAE